jgi:hypothetical protein
MQLQVLQGAALWVQTTVRRWRPPPGPRAPVSYVGKLFRLGLSRVYLVGTLSRAAGDSLSASVSERVRWEGPAGAGGLLLPRLAPSASPQPLAAPRPVLNVQECLF